MPERATSPQAIDIGIAPTSRQGGQEEPTNRLLTLIIDSHGEPVLVRSFRCLTEALTVTVGLKRGQTERTVTFPRGALDPRNRKMTIVDRPYSRRADGTYHFHGYQDVSHAIQFRSRVVRDRDQDEEQREYTTRTRMAACVIPVIDARDERGRLIQIMDPDNGLFQYYSQLCLVATWPNEPDETTEEASTEGEAAPDGTESAPDGEVNLDDLPT